MAMFESDLLKYEHDVKTLADIVNEGDAAFPIVVKTCGPYPDHVELRKRQFDLPENIELLLQRQFKEEFAHVKVLPFYDNTVMEKEYGPEYVLEHESYVDKEYLLPLNYGGNIKFVQRPGSTGRYMNMSQVITDGQGLVQLENTTEALSANDPSKQVVVKAKTRLNIKRKFHDPEYMNVYLIECSDGKMSYAFKEDDCVDCTAVDDNKTHNLKDVKKCNIFPRVIQFVEMVNPEVAVLRDREMNSAMQGIMEGPLELSGLEEREFMIGTVRDTLTHYYTHTLKKKKFKTFVTVLIPKHVWPSIHVKKQLFTCSEEKEKYINRKYKPNSNINFVEKCLYFVPPTKDSVVWLTNPALCKPVLDHGCTVFDVIPIPLNDSSDDESEEKSHYWTIPDIPPPVPKRPSSGIREKRRSIQEWFQSLFNKKRKTPSHSDVEIPPERPPKPDFSLPRHMRPNDKSYEECLNGYTISELFGKDVKSREPKERVPPKRSQSEPAYPSVMNTDYEHIYYPLVDDPERPYDTAEKDLLENILQSLSIESEIVSLKLEHQKQINGKSITAGKDKSKLENEDNEQFQRSNSSSSIQGDASSSPSNDTTENIEHLEISGNYDTISDDAIDNSASFETKSANNDKHDKMVQKSFLPTNIETSKKLNLNSCKYGNQHRVPDESNKEDDNGGEYEPVMGAINRDKEKHKWQYSHNLNKEKTSQARNSFLHSNIAVTCVDTRKEEESKARRDIKSNEEKVDNNNELVSVENLKEDNIIIQIIQLNERDSKESIETKANDVKKVSASKLNKKVSKRPNLSLSKEQQQKVLKDDQTESDFYSYTVAETAFCFEMCGLQKLADFCSEERVDGSFFKNLDSDLLVFCQKLGLSNFNICTLKSIIREGYRKNIVMV